MRRAGRQRNAKEFPILGVLAQSPCHGYDLCRDLTRQLGGIWTIRTSHIYSLLSALEKDGLVSHVSVGQEARPAKKVYRITQEGLETFQDWVRSPVKPVRHMRLEFLAKLHFAALESPSVAADLVAEQLAHCLGREKALKKKLRLCKTPTERAALDFRLAMVEATVAWLTRLRVSVQAQAEATAGKPEKSFTS